MAVPGLGLIALSRIPADDHGAAAGLFFAWFDAGVGIGGLAVGAVASLTGPAGALQIAAGTVAAAIPAAVGASISTSVLSQHVQPRA